MHGKKHLPYENTFPEPNSYFAKTAQQLFFINMSAAIITFTLVMSLLITIFFKFSKLQRRRYIYSSYFDIDEN